MQVERYCLSQVSISAESISSISTISESGVTSISSKSSIQISSISLWLSISRPLAQVSKARVAKTSITKTTISSIKKDRHQPQAQHQQTSCQCIHGQSIHHNLYIPVHILHILYILISSRQISSISLWLSISRP